MRADPRAANRALAAELSASEPTIAARLRGLMELRFHPYNLIDGRIAADLEFDGLLLDDSALVATGAPALSALEAMRDCALALQMAEAAGLLDRLLALTIDYTLQRRQFGRPIADFQALQHRMVDMYLSCELARSANRLAEQALVGPAGDRAHGIALAMTTTIDACRHVAREAVQLHGGIGMTDELPLAHYVKRALMIEAEWGDLDWHLDRIADA